MKVRCAGREAAEDRSLDLPYMVELAIDQGLAQVRGGFAVVGGRWRRRGWIPFSYRDAWQVLDIQASQIDM